jgi:hypothetical protein
VTIFDLLFLACVLATAITLITAVIFPFRGLGAKASRIARAYGISAVAMWQSPWLSISTAAASVGRGRRNHFQPKLEQSIELGAALRDARYSAPGLLAQLIVFPFID